MASDTSPRASWHPALMPNSNADLQKAATTTTQATGPADPPAENPDDNAVADASAQPQAADNEELGGWADELGGEEEWPVNPQEETDVPTSNNEPSSNPAREEENVEEAHVEEACGADPTAESVGSFGSPKSVASPATTKHFSTMSFTRTVAHEVTWNDDDDAEWTLRRTDSDPFKFMPNSNRTNSFPPVPPREEDEEAAQAQQEQPIEPLAFDQAEQLAQETEEEKQHEEALPSAVMGRDQADSTGQDAGEDARFEEGLPLIAAAQQDTEPQPSAESGRDIFAEDSSGEEDDFFSNVRAETAPQPATKPPTLQRKSTADVLSSMNVGTASAGFTPIQETVAEEAVAESQPPATSNAPVPSSETVQSQQPKTGEDLDAKWKEMFGDEDDAEFLADEETAPAPATDTANVIAAGPTEVEVDAAAFLGSDDEGLLEDEDTEQPAPVAASQPAPSAPAVPAPPPQPTSRYVPTSQASTPAPTAAAPPPNPYLPSPSLVPAPSPYLPPAPAPAAQPSAPAPYAPAPYSAPSAPPPAPAPYGYGAAAPPPQPEKKAQSFVDKSKGGYTSPYDLPMEVVKPMKRKTSAQPLQAAGTGPLSPASVPPPPRSASLYSPPPPPQSNAPPGSTHPSSSHAAQPPPSARKVSQESFFEDLPIITKVRPASRQSNKSAHSPTHPVTPGYPPQSAPPTTTSHPVPPPRPPAPNNVGNGLPELVAPPRVTNPYAPLPNAPALPTAVPPAPSAASTRYSPAPTATQGTIPVPAPATSRYSPAPPPSRQASGSYGPAPVTSGPPILPHQPRTSSPLAHFEITNDKARTHPPVGHVDGPHAEKRSSGLHEARLQRVPSLPPTTEVEEEEAPANAHASGAPAPQPTSPPISRYAPPPHARQTPPPPQASQSLLSPPRRVMSHNVLAPAADFAPPPRSMTQSPGSLYGSRGVKPADAIPRPSSVNGLASRDAAYPVAPAAPAGPPMGPWYTGQVFVPTPAIPPTDGRELDPLERWRGSPIVSWGVGGTLVTTFPKEVPRYGIGATGPSVVRSPGEVKIKNVKDIIPLEDRLAKFPGPLKGKSKKKETIAWLTSGIESLEQALPSTYGIHTQLPHDDKRAVERVLLWKILRVFIEHDGVLEGNPAVEKAVRDLLCPGLEAAPDAGGAAPYMNGAATSFAAGLGSSVATSMQPDGVSSSAVEQIRRHLLNGEREKAIWAAADQRLWGHALLLSNALAPDLFKQVSQEFIKKEVNYPGHNNESLAALYEVLAGNHEESVDELVPSHARAGLQMVATNAASGPAKDASEGLEKWRETLTLILSNRSKDDVVAIVSLGTLLAGYGRAEAAHICYMFGRSRAVFGGLDDPASHFVLVGSDHKKQADQFSKEIEPLLLSEVYEYGQSLASNFSVPFTNPHLAAYKLQHALALAEYGYRDKALQYCEALAAAITGQTKRSPYYHPILENAIEDLMRRLKQAPKEESSSWIPKPSMNKVSDTVWSKFNKFVSGEDDTDGNNSSAEAEVGPFARIAGGTPTISRVPSANNLESFVSAAPSYGVPPASQNGPVAVPPPPQNRAASRYAPAPAQSAMASGSRPSTSAYTPRPSLERSVSDFTRPSFEASRRSLELQSGRYTPVRSGSPANMFSPHTVETASSQPSPYTPGFQPLSPQPAEYPASPANGAPQTSQEQQPRSPPAPSYGFQPISYGGYEPPSMTPYEPPAEEKKEEEGEKKETSDEPVTTSTYEPLSFQPYTYEPPSYEPEPESQPSGDGEGSEEEKPKPKKKGIMYDDDDDDFPAPPKPREKTKEEKDRENAEMFRKIAEEEAKRAEAAKQQQAKKGWGFTSWFSRKDNSSNNAQDSTPGKPIKAKLGEPNQFYYDPELKRWVNKAAGAEEQAKKPTPPPPRASTPRSVSASPASPPATAGAADTGRASAPPRAASHSFGAPPMSPPGSAGGPPPGATPPPPGPVAMLRTASNTSTASAPPTSAGGPPAARPPTSLSTSSSIDDLLATAGPRKPGGAAARKAKRGARYVDVMNK
ncbi:hypothetical protein VTJ04DRAFT_7861 [Mycothermus thermophilus]|uniref:uncharacterized protein n=1 Tax=Humicola insolens TaxID=85995 RepID=UPI003744293F